MHIKKELSVRGIVAVVMLLSYQGISQEIKADRNSNYENEHYFNNYTTEKFFLHTNKSLYFSGEKLWWQAYVVSDFSNKPLPETNNLHVALYDADKNLVQEGLFFSKEGVAYGDFSLSEALESGTYFLSVNTQWNNNFNKPYVDEIQIVNLTSDTEMKQPEPQLESNETEPKLVFYPESGTVLDGVKNTLNFTFKFDNGVVPEASTLTVIDNTSGQGIARATSNSLGLGAVSLVYQPGHTYKAEVAYDNTVLEIDLPRANASGIVIQKNEIKQKNDTDFTVLLSKDLAVQYHGKTLYAVVHRNHGVRYVVPVAIKKQYTKYVLPLSADSCFNGVNTLSIFDSKNRPIAERHFYAQTTPSIDLKIAQQTIEDDSVQVSLSLPKSLSLTNVSVSVLPVGSRLNPYPSQIDDAFLLQPYLENQPPGLQSNTLNSEALDLVAQLFSRKTTINPYKSTPPVFQSESGINISGAVNATLNENETYKIMFSSSENAILEVVDMKSDKTFEFSNLIMQKDSKYSLALINEKGEPQKAVFYVYKPYLGYKSDQVLDYTPRKYEEVKSEKSEQSNTYDMASVITLQDVEQLEAVNLYGKAKEKEEKKDVRVRMPSLSGGFAEELEIDALDELNMTIIDFLHKQPSVVASDVPIETVEGVDLVRVFFRRSRSNTLLGNSNALIVFDGVVVDNDVLYKMRMNMIEDIKINPNGAGYGFRGSNGVLEITTKRGGNADSITPPIVKESVVDFGFEAASDTFVARAMQFNDLQSRMYYEALDWKPNVSIKPNRKVQLKVYKGQHKNIQLIVNGINHEGGFVYKLQTINTVEGL
ncbi:hypothetical protein [Formosa sp. A9]|uniref:hypothetical protein n=1 Tax=Formosa sp. A9 TaxID=3442641 RepID=UPI003EBF2CFB